MDYVLIIVILLIILVYYYYNRYKYNKRLPPGPWNLPIVGYLHRINPKSPYQTLTNLSRIYGKLYGLYLGRIYTVVLTDPGLIKKIFNKDIASGRAPLYLTHGIMKGYGLICAEGELWKDQRKFVHYFLRDLGASRTGRNRDRIEHLILEHAQDFVKFVKKQGDSVVLNPLEPLRHSLGSVINKIVFGRSWKYDDPLWKWLQHLQEEGTKLIGVAGAINFLPFLQFLPNQKRSIQFILDGIDKTHRIYQQLIDDELEKSVDSLQEPTNLIQAFIREKSKRNATDQDRFYNTKQFYHLLADIFGASLDTTLTTLRWYLLYMAKNPIIQKRIRDEISSLIGKQLPNLQDLASLPYVEASIAEVQRIRSVVPIGIPHGTIDDLIIDYNHNTYYIPKGTMLIPLQWAIHMNDEYWLEPEIFQPERFINENGKFYKPEAFMPFQLGKRMCVGDELARMLLFLFTTTIIQNFEISCKSSIDLDGDCGITLTPKDHELIFKTIP